MFRIKKANNLLLTGITILLLSQFISKTNALENPDATIKIEQGDYDSLKVSLEEGTTLNIEVEVKKGGNKEIDIYLLDSENFERFEDDQSITSLKKYTEETYKSFEYIAPSQDEYRVVFDNSNDLLYSRTVDIKYTIERGSINGYEIFLLISLIGIISAILIKKRYIKNIK